MFDGSGETGSLGGRGSLSLVFQEYFKKTYSWSNLVLPKMEELISQPFLDKNLI